jgi:hypothetical protein
MRDIMDVFNIGKSIEKFIFELLMWLIFYPYTLFRVIFQPGYMLDYARQETLKNEDISFDSGMKPSIFLFLSIVIAAFLAPLAPADLATLKGSQTGQYVTQSWINLLFFRMAVFSIFPITFALIYDLITPGSVTRNSLKIPFNQQCYICAPFTLITSLTFILYPHTGNIAYLLALIAAQIWLLASNFFFFKGQVGKSNWASAAITVMAFAVAWIAFLGTTTLALNFKD